MLTVVRDRGRTHYVAELSGRSQFQQKDVHLEFYWSISVHCSAVLRVNAPVTYPEHSFPKGELCCAYLEHV